jgi:hypothetical protein
MPPQRRDTRESDRDVRRPFPELGAPGMIPGSGNPPTRTMGDILLPPPDHNDLITPLLPSGYSPPMTVGERKGRFNFNEPPETGGTPGSRYAFDTEDGGRWYLQLERESQGGRWDDAHHAPDDFDSYKAMSPKERTLAMDVMWGEGSPIGQVVNQAAADRVSFRKLQELLATYNTHRQISNWEDK